MNGGGGGGLLGGGEERWRGFGIVGKERKGVDRF